jgi:hypothetical protein
MSHWLPISIFFNSEIENGLIYSDDTFKVYHGHHIRDTILNQFDLIVPALTHFESSDEVHINLTGKVNYTNAVVPFFNNECFSNIHFLTTINKIWDLEFFTHFIPELNYLSIPNPFSPYGLDYEPIEPNIFTEFKWSYPAFLISNLKNIDGLSNVFLNFFNDYQPSVYSTNRLKESSLDLLLFVNKPEVYQFDLTPVTNFYNSAVRSSTAVRSSIILSTIDSLIFARLKTFS